jgi:hypothetical protein
MDIFQLIVGNATYLIASLSSDGVLLLWSMDNFLGEPLVKYVITTPRVKDSMVLGSNSMVCFCVY